jgi:hypothetical protein
MRSFVGDFLFATLFLISSWRMFFGDGYTISYFMSDHAAGKGLLLTIFALDGGLSLDM